MFSFMTCLQKKKNSKSLFLFFILMFTTSIFWLQKNGSHAYVIKKMLYIQKLLKNDP